MLCFGFVFFLLDGWIAVVVLFCFMPFCFFVYGFLVVFSFVYFCLLCFAIGQADSSWGTR